MKELLYIIGGVAIFTALVVSANVVIVLILSGIVLGAIT